MNQTRELGVNAAQPIVDAFLATYSKAVSELDVEGLVSHWSAPCLMLMSGSPVLWEDRQGLRSAFGGLVTRLRSGGFTRASAHLEAVDRIDDGMIALSVNWELLDSSDKPIMQIANRYLLMRQGSHWQAKTMTERELSGAVLSGPESGELARRWLDDYRTAFRTLLPEQVAPYWVAPTLAIGNGAAQLCKTEAEVLAAFRASLPPLQSRRMTDLRPELKGVRSLGPGMLELTVDWDLLDDTGAVFKQLANVYLLRHTPDGWKVAAVYLA